MSTRAMWEELDSLRAENANLRIIATAASAMQLGRSYNRDAFLIALRRWRQATEGQWIAG